MRLQDENKKAAIFHATIKLVNEIGFVAASVSKIAKEANVSPATIYIYHKDKEDLLVSIFLDIQQKKNSVCMKGFDESAPLKESSGITRLSSFHRTKIYWSTTTSS